MYYTKKVPKPQGEKDLPFLYNPGSLIPRCYSAKINARKQIKGCYDGSVCRVKASPPCRKLYTKFVNKEQSSQVFLDRTMPMLSKVIQKRNVNPHRLQTLSSYRSPPFPPSSSIPHIYLPLSVTAFLTHSNPLQCALKKSWMSLEEYRWPESS